MKIKRGLGMLILMMVAKAEAMTVTYYSIRALPPYPHHTAATICYLDDRDDEIQLINHALTQQGANVSLTPQGLINRYHGAFKKISASQQCQYQAVKWGVTQLPAVVINHQAVIVGQRQIDLAVNEYQAYQERQHVSE